MRKTAGYAWTDHKTNTQIAKELKLTPSFGRNTEEPGCNIYTECLVIDYRG